MTNYFMMGADGREYGPASLEDLRQWIRERRANAATRVRQEGEVDWVSLGDLPEFADLLTASTGGGSEPEPPKVFTPPLTLGSGEGEGERMAAEILGREFKLNIGDCFSRGWELLVDHFWLLVGATALVYLLFFGVGSVPVVGVAVALCFSFVLLGGLNLLFLKRLRGESADMGVVFAGFSAALFLPLLLAGVVASALGSLGLLLCVAPGVYLIVCWHMFAPLLIVDKGLDFWQALECSRQVVTRNWWIFFGLLLLGLLAVTAGLVACFVGVVVTLPLATAAIVVAYEEVFGREPAEVTDDKLLPRGPWKEEPVEAPADRAEGALGSKKAPQSSRGQIAAKSSSVTAVVPEAKAISESVPSGAKAPGAAVPPLPKTSRKVRKAKRLPAAKRAAAKQPITKKPAAKKVAAVVPVKATPKTGVAAKKKVAVSPAAKKAKSGARPAAKKPSRRASQPKRAKPKQTS